MHYIYWIKKKDHVDLSSEGYIGYSTDPEYRLKTSHRSMNSNTRVSRSIRKYEEDIELIVLYEFETRQEALQKEKELRPKERIGWNVAVGGGSPPPEKTPSTRKKISDTLKAQGASPYSEKTHSPEARSKSKSTRERLKFRTYHNPDTLESKVLSSTCDVIPEGWVLGRKPKKVRKERGVDYLCNAKTWCVYKNDEHIVDITNLKSWCTKNNIPYLAHSRGQSKILNRIEIILLEKSVAKTVIENGIDTMLNQKDYALKIGKSEGAVSGAIGNGYRRNRIYDNYIFFVKQK